MRLVLAARSPRRADLLTAAGYEFEVTPADIDERRCDDETAAEYVGRLASEKAAIVTASAPDAMVLGADTVVVIEGLVLGKPVDEADAAAMLHRLSGRSHEVLTGVALLSRGRRRTEVVTTRVRFRTLTAADVVWYVASGEPVGKAGAYAIQGRASSFVTRIEGSYSNVVGLPVATVDEMIRASGAASPTGPGA